MDRYNMFYQSSVVCAVVRQCLRFCTDDVCSIRVF